MKAGKWIRIGILAVLVAGLLFLLMWYAGRVFRAAAPLWLGILAAYFLLPVVEWLEKHKLSTKSSIIAAFALSLMILLAILLWLVPILIDNIKDLADIIPDLCSKTIHNIRTFVEKNMPEQWRGTVLNEIDSKFTLISEKITEAIYDFVSALPGTVSIIIDILLAWIISFYILKDRDRIIKRFNYLFPEQYREDAVCFLRDIHRVVIRFIQGQVFIALILAVVETFGLYMAGMPYAPLLGFIGGVSNIIPYFGPYIGAVPAITVALAISPWKALWTAAVFIIAQQLDNIFLSPKIMKGNLGLHPITTIMAVIIGGRMFGVPGLLFGVPAAAMLKIAGKKVLRLISG
ncbi:MAG TPA: AI-2E family transporter [Ruminiclostridium sp.]|jgi:predicted PurR-regulated permease PerM|nr:AI-2E family transporter [Clostridiaceae bacterium]HAA24512.1 AI-2E family transporter [Ruminiclostridium sp.]